MGCWERGHISRRAALLACAGAFAGLAAPAVPARADAPGSERPPLRIALATDPHVMAPELLEEKGYAGDGPTGTLLVRYALDICRTLACEMGRVRPDVLVVPGDLTFGAEAASHDALAPLLEQVEGAGVPVLVLPGNHDVCEGRASSGRIDAAGFFERYARFGRDQALFCDEASFSYCWQACGDLWLLMVDCNCVPECGTLPAATLAWVGEVLGQAERRGARVVPFSHQTLYGGGYNGIAVANAPDLLELYRAHGIPVNFSGHVHTQHVRRLPTGLCDVTTMALSVAPVQYASIEVGAEGVGYRTVQLDVGAWAADTGSTDPNLLDFAGYAARSAHDVHYRTAWDIAVSLGAGEGEAHELAEYAAHVNCLYYAGRMAQVSYDPVLAARWAELSEVTAARYGYTLDPAGVPDQNSAFVAYA